MIEDGEFDMGKELQTSLLTIHRPSVIHQYPSSAPGRHESIRYRIKSISYLYSYLLIRA